MSAPPSSHLPPCSPDPVTGADPAGGDKPAEPGKYAGRRLGKFQIVGELGRGGMGIVLEARDSVLQRSVAVKMLPRSLAARPESLERFLREARAAAKLHHPNVVSVYEADQWNGQYYIVLELVRGGSLHDLLRTRRFDWAEATRVLVDACRGLDAAHRAGLVHRDIKPANLIRAEDGVVKLADFGLVRPAEPDGGSMTASGSVLGTPHFMSPEQCRSELADERSDLYAMGATYFALLTGRAPYPGRAPLLVMNAHLLDPVPDPRRIDATIPDECAAIIRRAMAKDPEDRYPDARALLTDLERVLRIADSSAPSVAIASVRTQAISASASPVRSTASVAESLAPLHADVGRPSTIGRTNGRRLAAGGLLVAAVVAGLLFLAFSMAGRRGELPASSDTTSESASSDGSSSPPAELAFRLPGLRRDERVTSDDGACWSMAYPGIVQVRVAPSGDFLVILTRDAESGAASVGGRVQAWGRDGARRFDEALDALPVDAALSRDGRRLAVGCARGRGVVFWNTETWEREGTGIPTGRRDVDAVALSDDGRWLAFTTSAAGQDAEWSLWDYPAHRQLRRTPLENVSKFRAIGFVSGAETSVAVGGSDGVVRRFTGPTAKMDPQSFPMGVDVASLAIAPEQSLLAVGAAKYFALWDCRTRRREFATVAPAGEIRCVALSADGRRACWAAGSSIQLVDLASRRPAAACRLDQGTVVSCAFLPDASGVAAASDDGRLLLWLTRRTSREAD